MPTPVSCPECGQENRLAENLQVKVVRCTNCQAAIPIPTSDDEYELYDGDVITNAPEKHAVASLDQKKSKIFGAIGGLFFLGILCYGSTIIDRRELIPRVTQTIVALFILGFVNGVFLRYGIRLVTGLWLPFRDTFGISIVNAIAPAAINNAVLLSLTFAKIDRVSFFVIATLTTLLTLIGLPCYTIGASVLDQQGAPIGIAKGFLSILAEILVIIGIIASIAIVMGIVMVASIVMR